MNSEHIMLVIQLTIGSAAVFLAIVLWSKTRDTAWMFGIIGVIAGYGETIFRTLKSFGIVSADLLVISGIPVFELVLANLPMLFFAIAFLLVINRKTNR
ncbi:MAG: hypothetical protein LBT33_10085 [Spirochaetia bacterium]|jgi:hypothetical protein|nr:hypothetical protein [Spirochaetia bacterium]